MFQKYQATYPTTLKQGEIWLIQTEFDSYEYEDPFELPKLASLIFCDSYGNKFKQIDLKYPNLYNEMTRNESNDYIMYSCYKNLVKRNVNKNW